MDGHRLTKLIKSDDKLKNIPVVIFSSLINEQMRAKGESFYTSSYGTPPDMGGVLFCASSDERRYGKFTVVLAQNTEAMTTISKDVIIIWL